MATKKEIVLYGDLIYQHKISLKTVIRELILGYFNKKRGRKESIYDENKSFSPPRDHLRELPLTYMAVVNNKKVVEMIRVDENTARAMQQRGSKLIEFNPKEVIVKKGMSFIDNQFIDPDNNREENEAS